MLVGPVNPIFSLHLASGTPAWEAMLFALGIALGLLLIVGYRTRIVTPLCWVIVGSLQYRNRFLLDAGDLLLRTMLLWSIFLPLGARWSLDARRGAGGAPRGGVVCSAASAALLLQFLYFYFQAGVLKSGPEWREEGTAVAMVLGQTYWAGVLNSFLLEFPRLLGLLTPLVVWFETLAPFVLFSPFWTGPLRVVTIAAFWAFQLSLGLGIELNLFPFMSTTATLPFLPTWLWDRLPGWAGASAPEPAGEAPAVGTASRWASRASTCAVTILFGLATVQFLDSLGVVSAPDLSQRVFRQTGMLQNWKMYGPSPPSSDIAFTLVARDADGNAFDPLAEPGGEGWDEVRGLHDTYRFKAYREKNVSAPGEGPRTSFYLRWICRRWNAHAPAGRRMDQVQLVLTRRMLAGPLLGQSIASVVGAPRRCNESSGKQPPAHGPG